MTQNILICGVGGQGTVLAAKILSACAINRGENVLSAETIGMAQRGGSVTSHVRIGKEIYSPLIPKNQADIIIAFDVAEAVRNISYLKKDGIVIVNSKVTQPTTANLVKKVFTVDEMCSYLKKIGVHLFVIDAEKISAQLGNSKVVNMILLGASTATNIFTKDEIIKALPPLIKPQFLELNIKAVEAGENYET